MSCQLKGCERSHCMIHCCFPSTLHIVQGDWTTLVPGLAHSANRIAFICIKFPGSLANVPPCSVRMDQPIFSHARRKSLFHFSHLRSYLHRHFHHLLPFQHTPPPPSGTMLGRFQHHTTQHHTMPWGHAPGHGNLTPPTHPCPSTDTSTRVNDVVVVASETSSRHCILLVTKLHRLVLLWKLGLASHARATLGDAS